LRFDNLTIALWGDTGRGKTFLLAELIDHLMSTKKQRSVVYMADRGWRTMKPQIDAGAAIPVPLSGDPFNWLSHAVKGEVLDKAGKWVPAPPDVGLYAFESGTSIGAELKRAVIASHANSGVTQRTDGTTKSMGIGPAANKFKVGTAEAPLDRASLDKGHFGLMQDELRDAIWKSQDLPGIILWTFLAQRKQDDDTKQEIIGPEAIGKALTAALPSWFHLSFHVDSTIPITPNAPEEHILYMSGHNDLTTGNARAGSNSRVPFGADPMPTVIKPASLVRALEELAKREVSTTTKMKAKYGV